MAAPTPRTFNAAFHIRLITAIEDELLELALKTVALVWDHHINGPQDFLVTVAGQAQTPDGVQGMGVYDPTEHHLVFALSMFVGTQGEVQGEARKAMIVSVAAHEAMHAVQHARGEDFKAAPQPGSPNYLTSPLEIEAHQESLLVIRGYYPEIRLSLPLGARSYEVPPTSPYTPLWEDLRQRGATIRVLSRQ